MADTIDLLIEIADNMQLSIGDNYHTIELIKILFTEKSKLSNRDYFDLGKQYDRMIGFIYKTKKINDREMYMAAVNEMRIKCYGSYQVSALK